MGRNRVEPTEENLLAHLRGMRNFQLAKLLTTREKNTYALSIDKSEVDRTVQRVLEGVDFIGAVERVHESVVLLQLILDLKSKDVVFISSKESGSKYTYRGKSKARSITAGVEEYLRSSDWSRNNGGDRRYCSL